MVGRGAHPVAGVSRAAGTSGQEDGGRRPSAAQRVLLGSAFLLWFAWIAFLVSLAMRR